MDPHDAILVTCIQQDKAIDSVDPEGPTSVPKNTPQGKQPGFGTNSSAPTPGGVPVIPLTPGELANITAPTGGTDDKQAVPVVVPPQTVTGCVPTTGPQLKLMVEGRSHHQRRSFIGISRTLGTMADRLLLHAPISSLFIAYQGQIVVS